ncbi:sialate O-acetylesterase [Chitinophaga tropicalis]|uniref:9-O-acetylesterase n=1 Tax=Chitinophaga tropicalis TaxID=2683588 RepID=A0A7K1U3P3_9BACT|nr:sialate O-acetylesterase [Chitinophaga tropicalis]MVT08971.1 9-O-acetylesterase [Chitinophaga tropicalis]
MKLVSMLLLLCIITTLQAAIRLPSVIGDHMVLQQQTKVQLWGWAEPGEKVTVIAGWDKHTVSAVTGKNGRWQLQLSTVKAGGPYTITIKGNNTLQINDVWLGEVWLCSGQSNMDMTVAREDRYWCGVYNEEQEVATANYPEIRVFDAALTLTDTVQQDVKGMWEICSPTTVGHFSAAAYFFARNLQQHLKVPIGLVTTAYGGSTAEAWIRRTALEKQPDFKVLLDDYAKRKSVYDTSSFTRQKYAAEFEKWSQAAITAKAEKKDPPREPRNPDPEKDQHSPSVLYNGMVAPLAPYTIRGAIWYQGESNTSKPGIYRHLMETLVADWREIWHQGDFPFFYVQLANHGKPDTAVVSEKGVVLVREAQRQNLSIKNSGMIVAIDNANPEKPRDIHPKNKQAIGLRLALLARGKVYGEKIEYSGPVYTHMKTAGNTLVLFFDHADGLKTIGSKLESFAIAGEDKQFLPADAYIEGNTIVLSNQHIKHPVAATYGWAPNPPANLYNGADLPASPFRTF